MKTYRAAAAWLAIPATLNLFIFHGPVFDCCAAEPEPAPMTLSGLPAVVSTTMPSTTTTVVEVGLPPVPTMPEAIDYYLLIAGVTPGQYGSAEWGRCTQYEPLLEAIQPPDGWDVARFSKIMWRESRCDPTARSVTKDSGLLQINDRWAEPLTAMWGSGEPTAEAEA
jgi:hypothetical protein